MKTFIKILLFVFILCMFPPVNFSQERDTTWILNPASRGVDSNTKTYKNPDGSRVFVSSGTPDTFRILTVAWYRLFFPNLEVPYKVSAEFKLESGINLDSVETFLTLEDSLGNWIFLGAQRQPLLNNEWQTLIWDIKTHIIPPFNLVSVKILQFSFQNRSRASYVKSVICVRNIKRVNIDNSFSFIDLEVTTGISDLDQIPSGFTLSQNYPNPFNPTTTIKYQLQVSNYIFLKIYDLRGREVGELVNQYQLAGAYEIKFNASNLPSGTYFYELRAGNSVERKKMVLVK